MRALARFTYLRAAGVLGAGFLMFVIAGLLSSDIFDRVQPFDINDPGSEEVRASRALEGITGQAAEPGVVLIVPSHADEGASESPASVARTLRGIPGIAKVKSSVTDPALVSADGARSLVLGYLEQGAGRVKVGEAVDEQFGSADDVVAGGTAVAASQVGARSEDDTRRLEIYVSPVLLLLLLFVFRTLVAAVIPLIIAGFSILLTFATLRLVTEFSAIDLFALQTVTGLGTGLAIDYSLFIISRYREEIQHGTSYQAAQARTLQTAGRTVAFSSLTVAAALASLIAFPQPFLHSTGIAGTLTALFAGITALVLLPAILSLLGSSINRFAIRGIPLLPQPSGRDPLWVRLPRYVCRRPLFALVVGGFVMVALASQAVGLQLRTPDAGELPAEESARVVADSLDQFPAIPATQLFAVVPDSAQTGELRMNLADIDGVTAVSHPKQLSADSVQLSIAASMDPLSDAGQNLVSDMRATLPSGALLGGRAAEQADQRSSIIGHAPLVIAIVVIANLLILTAMTGSLLLPLLAVAMNLLTVAAAIGALVIVFTTSWTADLLGTDVQSGIDMSVPVIVFAVGFGLSTDYGIFLFARIREERETGQGEVDAIVRAVGSTGRLISASAALLAVAVGAFAFSDLVIVKEFAVAIAFAVLLDATVVRGLLIPAFLRLLNRWAWLGPRWFRHQPEPMQLP